jgi:hypothetical protein
MRRIVALVGLAAIVALVIVAAPAVAGDKYVKNDDKPLDDARRPAPGKALVYFARPQLMGAAVKVKLYGDGEFLGIMTSEGYIPWEGDPGKHEFVAAAENAGFLVAELAADKIYFVQVAIHMGAMKARTHFEVARAGSEALDEVSKKHDQLRLITTTADGLAWIAEEQADIDKTIAKYRAKGEEFETLKPEDGWDAPPWSPAK